MTEQLPRIKIEPERTGTEGEGAAMLMQAYGVTLDPWQRLVVDSFLGTDDTGNYVTTACGISAPRQNGKNVIIECVELYALLIEGRKIIHSAHKLKTADKSFDRLAAIFENREYPEIVREVKRVYRTLGEHKIVLRNGGQIEYISRTRQGARGFDGIGLIVIDEAQEATAEQLEALLATLSASASGIRQVLYAGTPPNVGCGGDVFRKYRQSCIMADTDKPLLNSWFEWSVEGDKLEDIKLGDREVWERANPALTAGRLSYTFTQTEYETLTPDGFARERLGWWNTPLEDKHKLALDPDRWEACRSATPKPDGKCAYGVKFSADGSELCLAGAVIDKKTNKTRIVLIRRQLTGEGLTGLATWINERNRIASCVVIDGRNGADVLNELIRDVWKVKNSVVRPTAAQVCAAASMLQNDVNESNITWFSEQEELNASATSAIKRSIGQGWGFGGDNCTPIEAASLALWGVKTSKRNPLKQMRIDLE